MTELEAFITVVGTDKDARRYFDRTPEWWRGLLPKNVSWGYRAETDRYYVGEAEGNSLGIALARYTQARRGVRYTVAVSSGTHPWAVCKDGVIISKHMDHDTALFLAETLNRRKDRARQVSP